MTRNELIKLVDGLEQRGGFAHALGQALLLADKNNLEKLLAAFPELIKQEKARLTLVK